MQETRDYVTSGFQRIYVHKTNDFLPSSPFLKQVSETAARVKCCFG